MNNNQIYGILELIEELFLYQDKNIALSFLSIIKEFTSDEKPSKETLDLFINIHLTESRLNPIIIKNVEDIFNKLTKT